MAGSRSTRSYRARRAVAVSVLAASPLMCCASGPSADRGALPCGVDDKQDDISSSAAQHFTVGPVAVPPRRRGQFRRRSWPPRRRGLSEFARCVPVASVSRARAASRICAAFGSGRGWSSSKSLISSTAGLLILLLGSSAVVVGSAFSRLDWPRRLNPGGWRGRWLGGW
jgi:hypothetical protein